MSGFLFDRDFDQELEAEAALPLAPTPIEVGPDPRQIATQIEAARQAAYAEGHAAGFAAGESEARAAIEADIGQTLTALLPQIEALSAGAAAHRQRSSQDLAQMCLFLAERLVPEIEAQFGARRIAAFCRRAARLAEGPEGGEIRLSPQMFEAISPALQGLSTATNAPMRLIADPDLAIGEARATWLHGRADYAAEELRRELLSTLSSIAQTAAPDGL